MGYYLLDNENPFASIKDNGKKGNYYPRRSRDIQGIVIHTADVSVEEESTARYFAVTNELVSSHVVVGNKKIINLLPDDHTAFHVKSHNSSSLGFQFAYFASAWGSSKEQEDNMIQLGAKWCAEKSELYDIPVRRVSFKEWLKGDKGYISYSELSREFKNSPGTNFPWDKFFTLIKGKAFRKAERQSPKWNGRVLLYQSPILKGEDIAQWQDAAGGLTADGNYGQKSALRCKEIQKMAGLIEDGMVGPQTWYATFK